MCCISCVRRQAPLIDPARKTFLSPFLVEGKTRSSCCFRHPRFQKRKENPVKGLSDANRSNNLLQKRVNKIEKSPQARKPQHQKNHARQERERVRGRRPRRGTETDQVQTRVKWRLSSHQESDSRLNSQAINPFRSWNVICSVVFQK